MSRSEFGGYATIKRYVREKLKKLLASDRTFSSLYALMFSERDNVMAERTDGNKIIRTTYGECYDRIEKISPVLGAALENVALGSMVGLYMDNSIEWIQAMWAILQCGYRPLLLNMRLDDGRLYGVLRDYDVKAVVSDGRIFDGQKAFRGQTQIARVFAVIPYFRTRRGVYVVRVFLAHVCFS